LFRPMISAPIPGPQLLARASSMPVPPLATLHLVEAAGREEPFMEAATGVPEGCFETLALAGAETVERNREVVDPNA